MKTYIAGAIAAIAILHVGVSAQKRGTEQQVLAADDERNNAMLKGDTGALDKISVDDAIIVTNGGQTRTKIDQIAEVKTGQVKYNTIDVTERQVRMYDDVAVVVARYKMIIVLRTGQTPVPDERVTRVYKRFGGDWRLVANTAVTIK